MSKAPLWLIVLFPLAVQAGQSSCGAPKCSASVSVGFKIVIPEYVRVRMDDDGTVKGFADSRRTPVITKDEEGIVTISFP